MRGHRRTPARLRSAHRALFGAGSRLVRTLRRVGQKRLTPRYRGARWVSGTIMLLFAMQLVSGILLSLYYRPGTTTAYESARFILSEVSGGWLVRGIHHWAGELLFFAVVVHLALTFFRRAYAKPREYVWLSGVGLLVLVLCFRFTGRPLPWDAIGLEAARSGIEMIGHVPVLGDLAAAWLRGGHEIGPGTLARLFTTHVLVLPWLGVLLAALHLFFVGRHGLSGGRR